MSSKFRGRRGTARKPPICRPSPPIIPGAPPPTWPPDEFEVHLIADWYDVMPPGEHLDQYVTLTRGEGTNQWTGSTTWNGNWLNAEWWIDADTETGWLNWEAQQNESSAWANGYEEELQWGSPATYHIDEWQTYSPPSLTADAYFTF